MYEPTMTANSAEAGTAGMTFKRSSEGQDPAQLCSLRSSANDIESTRRRRLRERRATFAPSLFRSGRPSSE